MMNILCVFATMPVGGAEMLWLNVLRKLDRDRFNPITCCIGEKGSVGGIIENMGFEVISLGRMQSKKFDIGAILGIRDIIKGRNIDILHAHMYHAGLYGRLAALAAGGRRPKSVLSVHNIYPKVKTHRSLVNRALNTFTSRIIAVSEPVAEDVLKHDHADPRKVIVLQNGVDIDRHDLTFGKEVAKKRLGLKSSDFVLGSVGRLAESKGHNYMLEALSIINKSGYGFKLLIAGSGPLEKSLREESAALGLSEDAILLGERHDIPEIYRAMDLYLMSSLWEGAPLALADAMAAGLPSVATSVGGMPEQLNYGECGIIVPPKDPEAMANAVIGLYKNKDKMASLAEKARKRALDKYSSEAMVRKLEDIYASLFQK